MAYKKPAPKKKEILYFPKDFPKYKVVKVFKKLKSPRTRIFATNDPDEWFISNIEIKTRTGEVVDNDGWLIRKDIPDWVSLFKNVGWEETNNLTVI